MDRRAAGLSIGDAAEATGLSVKTIRYYEQIGLIPKAARTNGGSHTGGHRIYREPDLGRLRFIHHARLFGLGLADIRGVMLIAPISSFAATYGARLAHALPARQLEVAFGLFLLAVSARFLASLVW